MAIVSDQLARMGEDGWRMAAESWFGVAPVRSNPSRDQPRRNDSRLLPLQYDLSMNEEEYNGWQTWRYVVDNWAPGGDPPGEARARAR